MVSKTPFRADTGLTIIELILVIGVISVLIFTLLLNTNPVLSRQKARDQKRLSDLQLLERVVTEYRMDNGTYPDTENISRISTQLPSGQSALTNPRSGWIIGDFIEYTTRFPVDPINDGTYFYEYIHSNDSFEINAVLEANTSLMTSDSGNSSGRYEIGNDLTLLTN